MDERVISGVAGVISQSEHDTKVVEETMRVMLDWVKGQGYDVFLRREIESVRDVDRYITTLRGAIVKKG